MVAQNTTQVYGAAQERIILLREVLQLRKDQLSSLFTNDQRKKEMIFKNQSSCMEITKIVLTPLFEWKHPTEWGTKLASNGLYMEFTCISGNQVTKKVPSFSLMPTPMQFQPVFELNQPFSAFQ